MNKKCILFLLYKIYSITAEQIKWFFFFNLNKIKYKKSYYKKNLLAKKGLIKLKKLRV